MLAGLHVAWGAGHPSRSGIAMNSRTGSSECATCRRGAPAWLQRRHLQLARSPCSLDHTFPDHFTRPRSSRCRSSSVPEQHLALRAAPICCHLAATRRTFAGSTFGCTRPYVSRSHSERSGPDPHSAKVRIGSIRLAIGRATESRAINSHVCELDATGRLIGIRCPVAISSGHGS